MEKNYFAVDGWDVIEDEVPPTHCHHLKPLQEIIAKGKAHQIK